MVSISPEWRRAIAKQWLELTLCTYPSQSMNFLLHETDRFRNPVGQTHKDAIPMLVDEIFGHMDSAKVRRRAHSCRSKFFR